MPAAPLLSLRTVGLAYAGPHGTVQALADVTTSITAGEIVCVVGASGCGKTSLLRIIAGFLAPSTGTALIDGQPIQGPGADRGVVFQQPALYPWLSVADNVGFGLRMRGLGRGERAARVAEMLELVGLAAFGRQPPYELSGGMQQRAAIARVLINTPRIMLMDEPFGALDALTREHMQEELLKIWRATGTTIILITHSVDEAIYLGTRTLVMSPRPGRVVAEVVRPVAHAAAEGRDAKAQPEFIAAREAVLARIWRESDTR